MPSPQAPRVGLFATCLVDLFRPSVGFAAAKLLRAAGCRVEAPLDQSCCGQPAYNAGARDHAIAAARKMIGVFTGYDYVVAPSGSCAAMLRVHYPALFAVGSPEHGAAEALAKRSYELTSFLTDVMAFDGIDASFSQTVTYHDSCSGYRELGICVQPRRLLGKVRGLTIREMAEPHVCCGFGGAFCAKYPEISTGMATKKTDDITASGADVVLSGDMGCLLNIAGKLSREGSAVKTRHVAEVLAGETTKPPIAGRSVA